ncbi:hypothetical protein ABZU32_35980 [Sphaerisporangium sp. NPDC005288]|uniref:hypothetical protein n=1 Tax=Sphaerisporangium sp. NPDC005288 TaxID=3155114 RepID=UPI0033AC7A6D
MVQQLVHDVGAGSRPVHQALPQRRAHGIGPAVDEVRYQPRLVEEGVEEGVDRLLLQAPTADPERRRRDHHRSDEVGALHRDRLNGEASVGLENGMV